MVVYKRADSDTYSFDFSFKGRRYSGNTGLANKRAAQQYEQEQRRNAELNVFVDGDDLTIEAACAKWFAEVGQHHKNANDTVASLDWLIERIGNTRLVDLSNRDVARLVADRRGQNVTNATVNRTVLEPLRGIHRRASIVWEHPTRMIDWRSHRLREPIERVRELSADEQAKLFDALRPDYHPIVEFALLYGLRMQELVDLTWRNVDWHTGEITVTGKGDRTRTIELDDYGLDLLRRQPRAHARIFTRQVKRAGKNARGSLVPIEREALKVTFRRAIKKSGIVDFRFHDLRHTAASRLMRACDNIRQVQAMLGHTTIATTARYAHSARGDMRAALSQVKRYGTG